MCPCHFPHDRILYREALGPFARWVLPYVAGAESRSGLVNYWCLLFVLEAFRQQNGNKILPASEKHHFHSYTFVSVVCFISAVCFVLLFHFICLFCLSWLFHFSCLFRFGWLRIYSRRSQMHSRLSPDAKIPASLDAGGCSGCHRMSLMPDDFRML